MSLWAVLGVWLARQLGRLLLLVIRSPAAMVTIALTAAFVAGWLPDWLGRMSSGR